MGAGDDDFADFQTPSSTSTLVSILTSATASIGATGTPTSSPTSFPGNPDWPPDSPWYAIWQRHSPQEFLLEFWIVVIITIIVSVHFIGLRKNRALATKWIKDHLPVLETEFAMVGVNTNGKPNTLEAETLTGPIDPKSLVLEKGPTEFITYASGRANIAFAHITLSLQRRNNPIALASEYLISFVFDSIPAPSDSVTITLSPFDGAEQSKLNPSIRKVNDSRYDNFIWSLINKQSMRRLREERYDLSLTRTADWPEKIPRWLTTMGEAKEIGETIYTKDLQDAINNLPEGGLGHLIVSDQPIEKPTKVAETMPKKRISLHLPLSNPANVSAPLLRAFLRLADHLPTTRPFHPNVLRKLQATRNEQARKLQKQQEEELAEERDQKRAEEKKKERDEKLRGMSPEDQKKFLEKEKEKELRKAMKKGAKKA